MLGALNYDDSPVGVPVMCGNCGSGKINDADREDDDPLIQATYRDEEEWMFRTAAASSDLPLLFTEVALRECAPLGDCNGDGVFKFSIFSSNSPTGGAVPEDMQKLMDDVMQPMFDAACVPPAPCMRGIVENVEYDRNAVPEEFDYSTLVTQLLDAENQHALRGEAMPDPTDTYPPDFITGGALASFEAGITIEFAEQGADFSKIVRRRNFRSALVLQRAAAAVNGSYGISTVITTDTPSGQYLKDERGTVELADSNFYDAATMVFLAAIKAAQEVDDPTQITGAMVRDHLKLLSDKSGTVVYAGPDGLTDAIAAIKAGDAIDYDGASGPVDLSEPTTNVEENDDAGGEIAQNQEEYVVINEEFVVGDLFDCVSDKDCPRTPR
jgi:hypothetical protein